MGFFWYLKGLFIVIKLGMNMIKNKKYAERYMKYVFNKLAKNIKWAFLAACFSIFLSAQASAATPTFSIAFSPSTIGPGSLSTLTYTIDNSAQSTAVSDVNFSNTFPTGMTIASPSRASTNCLGSLSATAGGNSLSLSNTRLGGNETCTISVDVTSASAGSHLNTTGALSTSEGSAGTANATLTVDAGRPGFTMSFSPSSIHIGDRSTLTYTIDNSLNGSKADLLTFTHTFPTGQLVDSFANANTDCTGGIFPPQITATPGSNKVSIIYAHVAAGATCSLSVDVTRTSSATLENLTGTLSQNNSNPSGSASATLGLALPSGLSLVTSFVGNPFTPGVSETIQYTINNVNRSDATNISFSHDLDAVLSGLAATVLPANNSCGSGSEMTGSSTITFTGGQLTEGGSCTLEITVLVPANAAAGTYTSTITDFQGDVSGATTNGQSTSDLLIKKAPLLTKSYIDDPAGPGDDITVRYTITNTDPDNTVSSISFTEILNDVLPGTTDKTLPTTGECGTGSTFTSNVDSDKFLNFVVKDANIPAGDSCEFDLILTLGNDISPGSYTTASSLTTATVSGTVLNGNAGIDTLVVVAAPKLTTAFGQNSVVPGDNVTLDFTLTYGASATADAENISFTNDLNAVLTGLTAVTLPADDFCGTGSSITGSTNLSITGANLTPGTSCSFNVTLEIPSSTNPTSIENITSAVTATVAGKSVSNAAAKSDFLVITGLSLSQSFITNPAFPGTANTIRFTITNSASSPAATDIEFTYDLNAVVSSLAATSLPSTPCGSGSTITGTTNLSFSGGNLTPGTDCTFDVPILIPAGATSGIYNAITSDVSATVSGVGTTSEAATDTLTITDVGDSLFLTKSFLSNNVVPGSTVDLQFTLSNTHDTETISSIAFTDDLDTILTGLASTSGTLSDECGTGSEMSGTGLLTFTGGELAAGTDCTITVSLQIPATVSSYDITNTTSSATGLISGLNITANPATADLKLLSLSGNELKLTKSFQSNNITPGQNVDLVFTLSNTHASETISNIAFTDDLDGVLSGLTSVSGAQTNICRTGSQISGTSSLSFTGGTLSPGASCAFTVTLKIPIDATASSISNTTSSVSGTIAGISTTGSAATADLTLQQMKLTSIFDSSVLPGETAKLSFTIENLSSSGTANSIGFSNDIDNFISGAEATNLPLNNICGSGSSISGTNLITLSNASLASSKTCTFTVEIKIPLSTDAGVYTNTSSDLEISGAFAATPAIANLVVKSVSSGGSDDSGGFSPSTTETVKSATDPTKTATVSTTVSTIYDVSLEEQPTDSTGGIEFPFGVLSFKMLTSVGGTESATITFSEPLPSSGFFLYKVDDSGNKSLIPNSLWSQSGNSISIKLTDGGPFDLDGVENGIIIDPVTIGVPTEDGLQVFEFSPWQSVAFNQWISSDPVTISGISQAVDVSITGGLFSIDGGDYQRTDSTISLGQKLKVIVKSADEALSTTSATITVGIISTTFEVTTGSDEINQLLSHGNSCSSNSVDLVQKAYIAYYGRPADTGGVNYWSCAMDDNDGSLAAIIDAFGNSREFTNQFGGLTNGELIDAIYLQLFNRTPEEAGKAYWLEQLESGSMSLVNIAISILNGALNDDLTIINNKLEVAKDFTFQTGASGVTTIDFYDILDTVTEDSTSVTTVKESIPTLVGLAASKEANY